MDKSIVEEIKQLINVICLLQHRESQFRKDLEFFNRSCNEENLTGKEQYNFAQEIHSKTKHQSHLLQALSRLAHEVMFLCIDVYSLYEGVQKKKSLYARIIKNNSKAFVQISQSRVEPDTVIFLGKFTDNGVEEPSNEDKRKYVKFLNQESLTARRNLRDKIGPKSHNHVEMDEWRNDFLDEEIALKLGKYRDEFAHRLNSLDKIQIELKLYHPVYIQEILDVISVVLNEYKSMFRGILSYTTANHYMDICGFRYDSLSRIQEWEKQRYKD